MSFCQPPRPGHDLLVSRALAAAWQPASYPSSEPIISGLDDLDRIGALKPGQATIVSGHPGVGSSALMLGIALRVASQQLGSVLYATDHLDSEQVEQRLFSLEGRVGLNGPFGHVDAIEWERHERATLESLARQPIAILTAHEGVTPRRIASHLAELKRAGESVRLLIIDRISMLRPSAGGTNQTASLAAELLDLIDVRSITTIIVEPVPIRPPSAHPDAGSRVPTVAASPLFGSLSTRLGSVLWLHRAEMYDEDTPNRGIGEIHVLWQRQGATGVVRAAFIDHLARWANLAQPPNRPQDRSALD